MIDFADLSNHCAQLVALYGERDRMLEEIRQMFHMEWRDPPKEQWIKKTMSPSPFNYATGAIRLLMSTKPQFSVPFDKADNDARSKSERIEKAAASMWLENSKALRHPMEYDALASAVLFAEINGSVTKTADLLSYAQASESKGNVARMEALAARTPYVFRIYDPSTCYADYDAWGLRGMLRRQQTTWGEVDSTWGQLAEDAGLGANLSQRRLEKVILLDWYDWECRCVWIEGAGKPIYHEEHGLEFLPVVSQITEGISFFDSPEKQRMPMLYAVWKSDLWKRSSLMLTVIYSLIFAIGSNPLLKRKTSQPGSPINIDRSILGGLVDMLPDEDIAPLVEKVIDPSQWTGLQTADALIQESTISKQALGAPPQTQMAFSAISLLAQAGRLPLTGPKELGGDAIAEMVTSALMWMKKDGTMGKLYHRGSGKYVDLSPSDIPERLTLECLLEPDLPTDKLQMMTTANESVKSGLASKRWARENIINIGQSEAMDKEIYMEQRLSLEAQARLAAVQAMLQQKYAQALQQTQPEQPPGQAASEGQPLAGPQPPRGMPGAGRPEAMGAPEAPMPGQPGGNGQAPPMGRSAPPVSGPPPEGM